MYASIFVLLQCIYVYLMIELYPLAITDYVFFWIYIIQFILAYLTSIVIFVNVKGLFHPELLYIFILYLISFGYIYIPHTNSINLKFFRIVENVNVYIKIVMALCTLIELLLAAILSPILSIFGIFSINFEIRGVAVLYQSFFIIPVSFYQLIYFNNYDIFYLCMLYILMALITIYISITIKLSITIDIVLLFCFLTYLQENIITILFYVITTSHLIHFLLLFCPKSDLVPKHELLIIKRIKFVY